MRNNWRVLLGLFAVLSMLTAACGGDSASEPEESEPAGGATEATEAEGGSEEPTTGGGEGASGTIAISGSSTVEPISAAVAEQFAGENPDVSVSVDGPGTGDGFELFCQGQTQISDASRPIAEEEAAACEEAGIEFIELQVANDGIAVLTNPANEAVSCLGFADLYALVGPESTGFSSWDAANDLGTELEASNVPYPSVPLEITAPGEESGTYDSFVEIVFGDLAEEREQEEVSRPDYNASADDNVIIQGIEGSESSLGWVGFAFSEEAGDGVKPIAIEDPESGECVEATAETIADNSYPISRPLFIYVNANELESNTALESFVDLYLSDEGIANAESVGYVALEPDRLEEVRAAFEDRTTGTQAS